MKYHHIYDNDLYNYLRLNYTNKREMLEEYVHYRNPDYIGEWWEGNEIVAPIWHNKHYKKFQENEDYLWNNEDSLFEEWVKAVSEEWIFDDMNMCNFKYKCTNKPIKE